MLKLLDSLVLENQVLALGLSDIPQEAEYSFQVVPQNTTSANWKYFSVHGWINGQSCILITFLEWSNTFLFKEKITHQVISEVHLAEVVGHVLEHSENDNVDSTQVGNYVPDATAFSVVKLYFVWQ